MKNHINTKFLLAATVLIALTAGTLWATGYIPFAIAPAPPQEMVVLEFCHTEAECITYLQGKGLSLEQIDEMNIICVDNICKYPARVIEVG